MAMLFSRTIPTRIFNRVYDPTASRMLRSRVGLGAVFIDSNPNHPLSSSSSCWRTGDTTKGHLLFSSKAAAGGGGVYGKISFLGAGKMAEAMISPLIDAGIQPANGISIYDVSHTIMDRVCQTYPGVQPSPDLAHLLQHDIDDDDDVLLVLAVKPQNLTKLFQDLKHLGILSSSAGNKNNNITLLSIVAGKPIRSLVDGTGIAKVARSMPNTPAQIGQGVTVWSCTQNNMDSHERTKIQKVLDSFGKSIYVEDESFIDMSTSISGSGPAYVFLLMEAMMDAGVHMGFSRETASTLVHHTLLGSTLYAMETGQHPVLLRNSVTSPAGTTASAIYELEKGKFRTVIKDAIWACYRRSLEMGGADSNVGPGRRIHNPTTPNTTTQPTTMMDSNNNNMDPTNEHHPVEAPAGEMTDVSLKDTKANK